MEKDFKFFWFSSIAYIVRFPTEMCISNQKFHALSIFRQNELIWHSFCHQLVPLPQEHSGANACSMELPRLKKYKRSAFLVVIYNIIRYGTSYEVWDSVGSSINSQVYIQGKIWLEMSEDDAVRSLSETASENWLNCFESFFLKKKVVIIKTYCCVFFIFSPSKCPDVKIHVHR